MDALADTAPAFVAMAHRIVWATVATTEPDGRPRTRVLHPIWAWDGEALTGWIATAQTPVKVRAIAAHPQVSLTYWDPTHDTCTADCDAAWIADDEKPALWDRFLHGPEPVGYDPSIIPAWTGPDAPAFSGLRLTPTRLRVQPAAVMLRGDASALRRWSLSGS